MQKTSPNKRPSIVPLTTQDPEKPHLCPSLVSRPEFHFNPAGTSVSSNRHRVRSTEYEYQVHSTHDIYKKNNFFGLLRGLKP